MKFPNVAFRISGATLPGFLILIQITLLLHLFTGRLLEADRVPPASRRFGCREQGPCLLSGVMLTFTVQGEGFCKGGGSGSFMSPTATWKCNGRLPGGGGI